MTNMLQISMPPMQSGATIFTAYKQYTLSDVTSYNIPYKAVSELDTLRPWHTVDFGGQPLVDFFNAQVIESTIRVINADSSHAGGVRIRFRTGATYANLVKVLDIMNYSNQKKYWLDNRYRPATLYAITNKELPKDSTQVPMFPCGTRYQKLAFTPESFSWQRLLAEYWPPAWRLPWLLLLALGALNADKLTQINKKRNQAT